MSFIVMRRPERLAEALKEEISEVVGYELDDPELQNATVTDVEVSPDMRDAKVYVLVNGNEPEIRQTLRNLQHAAGFVRQQVALNLDLRFAPHIHFARDTAEENAARVGQLLNELTDRGEFIEKDEG
ncbi:MAG TPA: 30S ribosome-binding factor RbfA [Pyrinomonadaceae bacterium]|nr:30S ribosome-binding factor RbfA [Pyrinomonadaceae bacterium]